MEDIKDRLKLLRRKLGLKQREVADRLGVKVNVVGSWEVGRHIPDARIYQICKEFNVNEEWLRNGVGDMFLDAPKPDLQSYSDDEVLNESILRLYSSLSPEYRVVARKIMSKVQSGASAYDISEFINSMTKDDDNNNR